MSNRWLVERSRDVFDEVKANYLTIMNGVLVFHNKMANPSNSVVVAFAQGQWITVVRDED